MCQGFTVGKDAGEAFRETPRISLLLQPKTVTISFYHKQITPTLQKTFIHLSTAIACLLPPLAKINGILANFFLYLLPFPEMLIILLHLLWNPSRKSSLGSLELQRSALHWIQPFLKAALLGSRALLDFTHLS